MTRRAFHGNAAKTMPEQSVKAAGVVPANAKSGASAEMPCSFSGVGQRVRIAAIRLKGEWRGLAHAIPWNGGRRRSCNGSGEVKLLGCG